MVSTWRIAKASTLFFLGGCGAAVPWYCYCASAPSPTYFNGAEAVKVEEHRRYPCQKLQGYDVVVRNYFVKEQDVKPSLSLDFVCDSVVSWLYKSTASTLLESAESNSTHTKKKSSLLCCSTWPPCTQKYTTLVLEPQAENQKNAESSDKIDTASASTPFFLERLMSTATDQTVVRCNPMSREVHLNCENTGTLEAPYLRTMLTALAWVPSLSALSPLHVGVLGVGGGALPVFLQRYLGRVVSKMELVDVEPACFLAAMKDMGMLQGLEYAPQRGMASGGDTQLFAMEAKDFLTQWGCYHRLEEVNNPSVLQHAGRGVKDGPVKPFAAHSLAGPQSEGPMKASPLVSGSSSGSLQKFDQKQSENPTGIFTSFSERVCSAPEAVFNPFDLLLVDLYVGNRLSLDAASSERDSCTSFLTLCRANLSRHGIVAFNLPHREKEFEKQCAAVFGGPAQVWAIPSKSAANYVVIATKHPNAFLSHRLRYQRAKSISQLWKLPFALEKELPLAWKYW